jgi:hypothetical protein
VSDAVASDRPSMLSGAARLADDTRIRFLREIVARVPIERIVEVHLFTPIRQGGVETGVAVVAAHSATEMPNEAIAPEATTAGIDPIAAVAPEDAASSGAIVDGDETAQGDPTEDAAGATPSAEPTIEATGMDATEPGAEIQTEPEEESPNESVESVEASAAPELSDDDSPPSEVVPLEALTSDEPEEEPEAPELPPVKHTIFTGRYRLTIKGPDRGRWDADVVEEADAPLVTVAAVVRGVQRRAGDAADADRLSADAIARALGIAAPGA